MKARATQPPPCCKVKVKGKTDPVDKPLELVWSWSVPFGRSHDVYGCDACGAVYVVDLGDAEVIARRVGDLDEPVRKRTKALDAGG